MKTQRLRPCAAVLAVVWCLAIVVALATPAEAAPPDPPSMQRGYDDVSVDYTANPEVHGNKPVGTSVIVRRAADGSTIPCLQEDPLSLSSWGCTMDQRNFPQNRDATTETVIELKAHTVNGAGEESTGTPFRLRIQPSIFKVTTPPKLADGDLIVLEGQREMHVADVRWTVTRGSVTLVDFESCRIDDGKEDAGELDSFACTYDSTAARESARSEAGDKHRRSAHARLATAVPPGTYSAVLQEFVPGDTVPVDEITFAFTVGTPPATTTPPAPKAPKPTTPSSPGRTAEAGPGLSPLLIPPSLAAPRVPVPSETEPESPLVAPGIELLAPSSPTPAAQKSTVPLYDPFRVLVIGIIAFTTLAMIGAPGLGVAGRFAPTSTRTGGGAAARGRWPRADAMRSATVAAPSAPVALAGAAGASVDGADDSAGTEAATVQGWGDRSGTWRAPGHEVADRWGRHVPVWLSPRFPLLARILADSSHLRAAFGSAWALSPIVGGALGLAAAVASDGRPLAPGLTLIVALMIWSVLDAAAGLAAATAFALAVLVSGGLSAGDLTLAQGLRGLLGLAALWALVPLIAGAARPFRRLTADGQVYGWDRIADTVIAALITGWAVQGIVGSLGDLVGRPQSITQHADALALTTIGLVMVRFAIEEVIAHGYPARLQAVHDHAEPAAPTTVTQVRGIVLRTTLMVLFAWAFIGHSWHLWVGVGLFLLPQVVDLLADRIPDVAPLRFVVPRGVVEVMVMVVIGSAIAYTIDAWEGRRELDALRIGFVALAVPGAVMSVLAAVGGEPPAQRWTWSRQLAGAAVVAFTVILVLVLL